MVQYVIVRFSDALLPAQRRQRRLLLLEVVTHLCRVWRQIDTEARVVRESQCSSPSPRHPWFTAGSAPSPHGQEPNHVPAIVCEVELQFHHGVLLLGARQERGWPRKLLPFFSQLWPKLPASLP